MCLVIVFTPVHICEHAFIPVLALLLKLNTSVNGF